MDLKAIFTNEATGDSLTYEQFTSACKEAGIKLADLSTGDYVSRSKYDSEISGLSSQIESLNEMISSRDTDLADVKAKLESAGTDQSKLAEITSRLETLKAQSEAERTSYQEQLSKQAYEFAVKEFAGGREFTSKAARRDFINAMIGEGLKLKDGVIMGADDFVNSYSKENEDAFVVAKPEGDPTPKPTFAAPSTTPESTAGDNLFNFNFAGVRSH